MINKLTHSESLSQHRVSTILRKSSTTRHDLEQLTYLLGIYVSIDWQSDFDPTIPYQILNLGNGLIGGTHWVAADNKNKRYFDSFGLPPPPVIPSSYEWQPLQIQDVNYGHCGQYASLFLYYSKKNELDQFYNLFHK